MLREQWIPRWGRKKVFGKYVFKVMCSGLPIQHPIPDSASPPVPSATLSLASGCHPHPSWMGEPPGLRKIRTIPTPVQQSHWGFPRFLSHLQKFLLCSHLESRGLLCGFFLQPTLRRLGHTVREQERKRRKRGDADTVLYRERDGGPQWVCRAEGEAGRDRS